jgi:hypothetical protein
MPLKEKYQPVVDLIEELHGEIIKAEEERGFFVIEGLLKSEDEIDLVKRKAEKINDIKADDIKLKLEVKQ